MRTTLIATLALLWAICDAPAFGAVAVVESARVHSAAGANGCAVSGATNATPIVITCAAAHNLVNGDEVQITGVGGNTNANTTGFVNVLTTTTFGLYSNSTLTTAVAGNAAYTSGGQASQAFDISGYTGDYTLRLKIDSLTANLRALVTVQNSTDGFVNDIQTVAVYNLTGPISSAAPIERTYRAYQLPSSRFGVANGRVRVFIQSLEGVRETLNHLEVLSSYGVGYRSFTEQYLDSCGIFKDAVLSILATIAKGTRPAVRTYPGRAATRAQSRAHRWTAQGGSVTGARRNGWRRPERVWLTLPMPVGVSKSSVHRLLTGTKGKA
jgi:hypothetical protein